MYQALYRKWRPMKFEDVVGQEHITTTLKNQIINGKTAHAYLFTGSRGTGKTTCARIFAKTINCKNSHNGTPCLECEICRSADEGILNDIVEIDAASNTGVDNIRELRESAAFMPELGSCKVYIIDEVHMLSAGAFNALLKIMEEPPAHVKFILATTEIHKVPATIISRCQRFDFRRLKPSDIVGRLQYVAQNENFTLDDNAAALIAKLSDGGMRDALSLLDQCVSYSDKVDVETVTAAAGIAGREYIFDLIRCIRDKDSVKAVSIIDSLYEASKDVALLCSEVLSQLRNIMIEKAAPGHDEYLSCLPDEISVVRELAGEFDQKEIFDKLAILQDANERLPRINSKRIEIEMCFIKLCSKAYGISKEACDDQRVKALEERINRLEQEVSSGDVSVASKAKPKISEPLVPAKQSPVDEPMVDTSKIKEEDLTPMIDWSEVVEQVMSAHPEIGGFLVDSKGFEHKNVFFIIVDNDFFLKLFKQTNAAMVIQEALKKFNGKTYAIRVKSARNVPPDDKSNPINRLIEKAKSADVEVEIKD